MYGVVRRICIAPLPGTQASKVENGKARETDSLNRTEVLNATTASPLEDTGRHGDGDWGS